MSPFKLLLPILTSVTLCKCMVHAIIGGPGPPVQLLGGGQGPRPPEFLCPCPIGLESRRIVARRPRLNFLDGGSL